MSSNNIGLNPNEIVVSICCLAYNHESYIRECLDGFMMQKTDFAFEVLIHDDASTDNTAEIIREYEVKYPNIIKPIYQTENQYSKGVKPTFEFNFPRAQGKYIAMCEGDDYWTDPYKLQKQVDFLEENRDYGLVHTNFDTFYQNDNFFLKNTHNVYDIYIKEDCAVNYWNLFGKAMATIKTPTVCFRKQLLNDWQLDTQGNSWAIGDFPMYFYISLNSKIGYINNATSVYRTVPSGSASNVGKDNNKKLLIRKSYVDIRLFFIDKYKLDKKKFKKALIRDLNTLLDYCIITDNKDILNEYLELFVKLNDHHKASRLSRLYKKSNHPILKRILKIATKIKMTISGYLSKIFNYKFLTNTIERKLKIKNV